MLMIIPRSSQKVLFLKSVQTGGASSWAVYVCVFSAAWNVPCWGRLGSYKGSAGTENVVRLSSPGDPVVYTQIPDAAFSQRTQLHHMLVCHMHRPPPFEVDHRLWCISS
ncbi:hypothetical protein GBAR_LOCUS12067 [Geodia barretti]|uniref:Uncharacterized protein n=1 Tax=Geodia barretti TaxID=519541 RepID=A0AA35WGZ3_GEOBA|nr:hypothetical protein GBAR_LOCUS12067 [Geodia barretti]